MNNPSFQKNLNDNSLKVRHILVVEDPEIKRTVTLDSATYSIGRHSSNSIILSSQRISRQHATLLRRTDVRTSSYSYWILDGDLDGNRSRNGIFINGKKCLVHELKHGDVVEFGAEVKARYHIISDYSERIEHIDDSEIISRPQPNDRFASVKETVISDRFAGSKETVISDRIRHNQETVVVPYEALARDKDPEQTHLNSFAELDPNPIVEIDLSGQIKYRNSAALVNFQNLDRFGLEHPILVGLIDKERNHNGNLFVREVIVDNKTYRQNIHYLAETQVIRCYLVDISEQKKLETELKKLQERYIYLFSQISESVAIVEPVSKRIVEVNNAYCKLLGYARKDLLQLTLDRITFDEELLEREWQSILKDKTDCARELSHRRKDNSLVKVHMSFSIIGAGEEEAVFVVVRDLTQQKVSEERLRRQACHDEVTGLPNQVMFNKQLTTAIAHAKRNNSLVGIMFLELDYYKNLATNLGNSLEDKLLENCAERLKTSLRSGDTIGYWGSDKFAVLMPQISNFEEVAKISQRILEIAKQPFKLGEHQLNIRVNMGIAIYPQDGAELDVLIENADLALQRTKEEHKNSYQFHSLSVHSRVTEAMELENSLYHAIEKDELLLHYQPQVNIHSGEVKGIEALLRWRHSELGVLMPADFMNIAEHTGLILPIGEWVLKTACAQNKLWQHKGLPPVKVSVNLSPLQFQQPNLVSVVERILKETQLEASLLELEIKMDILMQNVAFAKEVVHDLQEIGINVAVDDFGSAFSAFSYNSLKELSLNTLKIDRSFVQQLKEDPQDLAIVSAVVTLGRGFNLRIVAEGVETQEQFEILRNQDCEEMQGNWFSRPLAAEEATKFLPLSGDDE
jgi:diguanylate cyclase (GGDEF)-like protein/PAS domain S-box-containing protein